MIALGLIAMEAVALVTHTDGAFFMPVVAAVSGIAGYKYKSRKVQE